MVAAIVFVFTYVAFTLGRVPGLRSDRMGAAVVGAALMLAFRVLPLDDAQAEIDGGTIALLFGMMVLSAALEISGAFAFVGWWITRRAKRPVTLLAAVSLTAAVLSAFLINDVVCIAFTPLVLHVTEALERDPKPYLLALATSSNIGSVATITGNPQNILIGSLSHLRYTTFSAALAPVAAFALVVNFALLAFVHRKELRVPFAVRAEAERPRLFVRWVWKGTLVTAGALIGMLAGAPPPIVALAAGSMVLLTRAVSPTRVYARIDWGLLALFCGLFVVVAGVEKVGLAERMLAALGPLHPESAAGLTAIAAILSSVVSNVPAVMVLKQVVPHLPDSESAWLVLAMASTLAGNLTLPGSLATIIVAERAKHKTTITFWDFTKVGAPAALVALAAGAAWLAFRAR